MCSLLSTTTSARTIRISIGILHKGKIIKLDDAAQSPLLNRMSVSEREVLDSIPTRVKPKTHKCAVTLFCCSECQIIGLDNCISIADSSCLYSNPSLTNEKRAYYFDNPGYYGPLYNPMKFLETIISFAQKMDRIVEQIHHAAKYECNQEINLAKSYSLYGHRDVNGFPMLSRHYFD